MERLKWKIMKNVKAMQRAKEMNEIFCPVGFSEERKDHEFPLAEELEVIFISVSRT